MAADLCFISKYISIFSSSANEIATGLGTLPISEAFQTVFVSRLLKQKLWPFRTRHHGNRWNNRQHFHPGNVCFWIKVISFFSSSSSSSAS